MTREYMPRIIDGQVKQVRVGKLPKVEVARERYCPWCGHIGMWRDNSMRWHCPKCKRRTEE